MRKRLVTCIFLKEGMIIRSEDFKTHQIIGNPINQVKRFSDWAVDEIIYIDISRDKKYDLRRDDHKVKITNDRFELVKEISKNVFVPLTFGGGIRTIDDIYKLLQNGADKVVLNTGMYLDDTLLKRAVDVFGSQALVACVDYRGDTVCFHGGSEASSYDVLTWCRKLQDEGIGEILLHDISRDGKANGYDLEMLESMVKSLKVPVIALGGAGDYYDFVECFEEANPSAVAAGNIFHFKEHSYYHAKQALLKAGIDIRQEWDTLE